MSPGPPRSKAINQEAPAHAGGEKGTGSEIKGGDEPQGLGWGLCPWLNNASVRVKVPQLESAFRKAHEKNRGGRPLRHVIQVEADNGAWLCQPRTENVHIDQSCDPDETARVVIIYVRVSTDEQGDNSCALEDQLRDCLESAQEMGWTVAAVCWDKSTGRDYERPGLKFAIRLARTMQVDGLLTWSVSRFGRNERHGANLLHVLSDAGAPLVYFGRSRRKLKFAIMDDEDARREVLDALREAEYGTKHLEENALRGRLGRARGGRYLGERLTSLFYELTHEKPGEAPDDGMKTQTGRAPQYMVSKEDAQRLFDEVRGRVIAIKTKAEFRAYARELGVQPARLKKDLSRPWLRGHYYLGEHEFTDRQYGYLKLLESEEFDALASHLEGLEADSAPPEKQSVVVQAIQEHGIVRVYNHTDKSITVRCPTVVLGKACGLPMDLLWVGNDYLSDQAGWHCPSHGRRKLFTAEQVRRLREPLPHCTRCGFRDAMRQVNQLLEAGAVHIRYKCDMCGQEDDYTPDGPPQRRPAKKRHARRIEDFAPL